MGETEKGLGVMLEDTHEISVTTPTSQKRSSWYLLTGIILGLILGLAYAWLINPVIYKSGPPAALGEVDKDFYRVTIAQVFWVTGDLERASLRLVLLEDPDPVDALGAQAQRALATGNDTDARALALLASVLQNTSPIQAPTLESTSVPATATELPQPLIPTYTLPIPTSTP